MWPLATFHNPWLTFFGAARLLVLVKPLGGIQPIVDNEALYRLISRDLCLQFHDMFFCHMLLH
jgi:hypothetical protein